jgi:hypothetical protein
MTDFAKLVLDTCKVGAQKHGAHITEPVLCDSCEEAPATESWSIPIAPFIEHRCQRCADKARNLWLERHG